MKSQVSIVLTLTSMTFFITFIALRYLNHICRTFELRNKENKSNE